MKMVMIIIDNSKGVNCDFSSLKILWSLMSPCYYAPWMMPQFEHHSKNVIDDSGGIIYILYVYSIGHRCHMIKASAKVNKWNEARHNMNYRGRALRLSVRRTWQTKYHLVVPILKYKSFLQKQAKIVLIWSLET